MIKSKKIVPARREEISTNEEKVPVKEATSFEHEIILVITESNIPNSYNIAKIKQGTFKKSLESAMKDKEQLNYAIPIPNIINKNKHPDYIEGFILYIKSACKLLTVKDIKNLSESSIYNMAVVAANYGDTKPLTLFTQIIQESTDRLYWLYLGNEEESFYSTLEIEMYRRRTTSQLKLVPLTGYSFSFQPNKKKLLLTTPNHREKYWENLHIEERGFSCYKGSIPGCYKDMFEEYGYPAILNTNTNKVSQTVCHYNEDVPFLCENILRLGGIIAGGFVNSLVNPTYYKFLIEPHNLVYDNTNNFYPKSYNYHQINFDKKAVRDSSKETRFEPIPGLADFVRTFYSRKDSSAEDMEMVCPYLVEHMKVHAKLFKDYDLRSAYKKLKQYVHIEDGNLYRLLYNYSADIDIFLTGDKCLQKADKIANLVLNKVDYTTVVHPGVYCTEFATTFYLGKNYPKIQIIKRAYSSVEEILAGFDLDSSRVAMVGKMSHIVAPQAYINAVEYGVNLIVPCRQSETFNFRLIKYYNKGFFPSLPRSFPLPEEDTGSLYHTLGELFKRLDGSLEGWQTQVSDYEPTMVANSSHIQRKIKEREAEITKGGVVPTLVDVFKLVASIGKNATVEEKIKGKHLYACLAKYMTSLFWLTVNPGTQFTGSFNPTSIDYLANEISTREEKVIFHKDRLATKEDIKLVNILYNYTPLSKVIMDIIIQYRDIDTENIYINLLKLNSALHIKENIDMGEALLEEFNGGPKVKLEGISIKLKKPVRVIKKKKKSSQEN